jgi:uncharacterized protein YpmS
MKARRSISLAIAALILASLACNLPGSRQEQPAAPVPITTEAVEDLQENVQTAAETAQSSGEINLVITEAQLTSMLAFELQKQEEPILTEPQIYLQNGQIQLNGNVHQGGVNAPLEMSMEVTVNDQGRPDYRVTSAKLGPFPLPDSILDQLTAQIDQAFAEQIGPELENVEIESIDIAAGQMVIQGHTR